MVDKEELALKRAAEEPAKYDPAADVKVVAVVLTLIVSKSVLAFL